MKSKNFLKYPRKPGKYEMEKGSPEEREQKALLKVVEKLSKRKTQAYIYISGAGPCNNVYGHLQEVLWVGAKKASGDFDTITIFDGAEERTLSLWKVGDSRIREIAIITPKDIKWRTADLGMDYKKMKKKLKALVDFVEKCDFDAKDFRGKSRREKLTMLKKAYSNIYGRQGPAKKIKDFGSKYGCV